MLSYTEPRLGLKNADTISFLFKNTLLFYTLESVHRWTIRGFQKHIQAGNYKGRKHRRTGRDESETRDTISFNIE